MWRANRAHLHWPENTNHITGQLTHLTLLIIWQHYWQLDLDSHNNINQPPISLCTWNLSLLATTGYYLSLRISSWHYQLHTFFRVAMSKLERGSALWAKTIHLFQWHFLWECSWVLNPFSKLTLSLPTMHRPALNELWNYVDSLKWMGLPWAKVSGLWVSQVNSHSCNWDHGSIDHVA